MIKDEIYKFKIMNLVMSVIKNKKHSLFSEGMQISIKSEKNEKINNVSWYRGGESI